ncbi:MAG: hypothetical protein ACRDOE_26705, partial [Streptosporangiaceae bacterium]
WNSFWTWDLPWGNGKAINLGNALLDRLIGDWTLGGTEQLSSGAPVLLNSGRDTYNNLAQSGVVFGGGLTPAILQEALSRVPNSSVNVSGNLVSGVALIAQPSGAANPDYYAPASTPGAFSQLAYLRANASYVLNMSLNKTFPLTERLNLAIRMEDLNFLNHPFFNLGNTTVTGNTFGQVSSDGGTRNILLRATLNW